MSIGLGIAAMIRGVAMAWFTPPTAPGLTVARGLAAIQAWGIAFCTLGLILLVMAVVNSRPWLRGAHVAAWGIYGAFVASVILSAAVFGSSFSSVSGLLVSLALHITVARAYRPTPRSPGRHEPRGR